MEAAHPKYRRWSYWNNGIVNTHLICKFDKIVLAWMGSLLGRLQLLLQRIRVFWDVRRCHSVIGSTCFEGSMFLQNMWSEWSEVTELKWVTVKLLWIKMLSILRWLYTVGIWLYCDYLIWVHLAQCLS